jgi:hypothetical protein
MKQLFSILIMAGVIMFNSCSKDEDDNDNDKNQNSYEFKDQNLQGKIGGEAWNFKNGTAEVSYFDSSEIDIDLYQDTSSNICNTYITDGDKIFLSVPHKVGVHELSIDFSSGNSQTVTLYDRENTMNYIASQGAVEILTIDTSSSMTLTGRMDARVDDDTYVNGNFTVSFCK